MVAREMLLRSCIRSAGSKASSQTIPLDLIATGAGQSSKQTKQAAGDLSFSRRVEHANRLLEAMPRLDAERAVNTANEALTGGHIHEFKLDDATRADPLSHGDNPRAGAAASFRHA